MTSGPAVPPDSPLAFRTLGQDVQVDCSDPSLRTVIAANFAAMTVAPDSTVPALRYRVAAGAEPDVFRVSCGGTVVDEHVARGDILYALEQSLTVELQLRRADLLFLHAAAVEWNGRAVLFAAESGSGKSTTTWALLHHGFGYLSDELSPLDVGAMRAFAYPHALCLKQDPPPPYVLPPSTLRLGRTRHVPVASLPGPVASGSRPVAGVFLVKHRPDLAAPRIRAIDASEASARLYVTALNALAHPNDGLESVVRIAQHVPCFDLASGDLAATCALVRSTVERIVQGQARPVDRDVSPA